MHSLTLVAQAAGGSSFFDSNNVKALLILIAGFVIMFVGIVMTSKSNKGKLKDQFETFGAVLLGVIVIAIGAGAAFVSFGDKALAFFGIG